MADLKSSTMPVTGMTCSNWYGIATGKVDLPVTGLGENSDAVPLERQLAGQNGVLSSRVNYATGRVAVEYIPGMTSIAELDVLMQKAGFDLL